MLEVLWILRLDQTQFELEKTNCLVILKLISDAKSLHPIEFKERTKVEWFMQNQ